MSPDMVSTVPTMMTKAELIVHRGWIATDPTGATKHHGKTTTNPRVTGLCCSFLIGSFLLVSWCLFMLSLTTTMTMVFLKKQMWKSKRVSVFFVLLYQLQTDFQPVSHAPCHNIKIHFDLFGQASKESRLSRLVVAAWPLWGSDLPLKGRSRAARREFRRGPVLVWLVLAHSVRRWCLGGWAMECRDLGRKTKVGNFYRFNLLDFVAVVVAALLLLVFLCIFQWKILLCVLLLCILLLILLSFLRILLLSLFCCRCCAFCCCRYFAAVAVASHSVHCTAVTMEEEHNINGNDIIGKKHIMGTRESNVVVAAVSAMNKDGKNKHGNKVSTRKLWRYLML